MEKEYEDWFYNQHNCLPYKKHHGFTNIDELHDMWDDIHQSNLILEDIIDALE